MTHHSGIATISCTVFDSALPRLLFCLKIIHGPAQSDKAHMFSPLVDCYFCLQIVVIIGYIMAYLMNPIYWYLLVSNLAKLTMKLAK